MKKAFRITVVGVVCAALIIGYYYYLSHRYDSSASKDTTTLSETDSIITKDFERDYPKTPRAVVKWYNRIITEYYAEDHSKSEVSELANQTRKLLDSTLLAKNPENEYIEAVNSDIAEYKDRDKKIVTSKVCSSNDVKYETVNGYECAYVTAYYFVREGNDYTRSFQEYCLRKDADGNWKILTFRQISGDSSDFE